MSLIIKEKRNRNAVVKAMKMNRNPPIPNGVPPFDRYGFALLVCGIPNSGKSSFVFDQLTRPKAGDTPSGLFYRKFHKVYIFSPSTHTIGRKLNVPEDQIITEFDTERIEKIIEDQEADRKEVEEMNREIDEENKELPKSRQKDHEVIQQALLIFDDMMSDIAKDKSKVFMRMLMNRAHLGLTVICMTQVFNRIPSRLRKGFSDVILFKTKNRKELDSIGEELTAFNPKEYKQFIADTLIDQHDFLLFKTYSDEIYRNLNPLIIKDMDEEDSEEDSKDM